MSDAPTRSGEPVAPEDSDPPGDPAAHDPLWSASDLEVAVHNLETTVELLDEALADDEAKTVDWPDLAGLLKRLRKARSDLARHESHLVTAITDQWRQRGMKQAVAVKGVGMVEANPRPTPQRRDWRHQELTRDVIDAHIRANGGEEPDAFAVRDWLLEAAGIQYWRVTPLRDLGLVPDDYCTREPGPPTVKIT